MKKIKRSSIFIGISISLGIMSLVLPLLLFPYGNLAELDKVNLLSWVGDISTPFLSLASVFILIGTISYQQEDAQFQKFENTFFKLINFQHEIVKAMDISTGQYKQGKGREYFKPTYESWIGYHDKKINIEQYEDIMDSSGYRDVTEELIKAYDGFYIKEEERLGHYFRNLYHIFNFIDRQSIISGDDKRYYSSLIRDQLSSYELLLLFYSTMSGYGREKLGPLIEKYSILENMNTDKLIHSRHRDIYNRYV